MARGNIRAATSFVLIPVLVLQTACYSTLGPPEPVHPTNNEQMSTLRDAPRVDVVLIDGNTQQLRAVVVDNQRLQGIDEESQVVNFPLDSIQSVQTYVDQSGKIAFIIVGGVAVGALVWWLLTRDECFWKWFCDSGMVLNAGRGVP